jgi:thiamine biosynthesis protein ThiS
VELNKSVVPKQKYSSIKITNEDVVEIVTFIGGG